MAGIYVGIDVGGTNVKIGLFDQAMTLLGQTSVPTEADLGPEDVVARVTDACKGLLDEIGQTVDLILAIGIGTPGPADYPNGVIVHATNMPKFKNTPLRDMIAAELGDKPAVLENDANVACWGEFTQGVGKEIDDMIFFTLGTGIGGGIVTKGELVFGADYNAAELGHVIVYPDGRQCNCGQRGCVEAHASASHTANRANEGLAKGVASSLQEIFDEKGEVTCKDIFEHLETGDAYAAEVVNDTAKALALMCVNMLHTTEPSRIVFSGGMIAAGDALLSRIQHYFDEYIWTLKKETVEICFATLGENTGIIGAAALARHVFG